MEGERLSKKRKTRSDRKHRFTLRLNRGDFNKVRVIAFNTDLSLNRVMEMLLVAALESEAIIDMIYSTSPPGRDQFIYVEDNEKEDVLKWDF